MKKYDLVIIGAGPASLTAAIYAARYKLDVLIIGKIIGGLATEAYEISNFPTYDKIKGIELMLKMINQTKKLGVEIKLEDVLDIKKNFRIITNKGEYSAKKIIIATGLERRKLGIDREKEFIGKGISYCATCDSGFYKDKTVGVIGGGNSVLTSALLLAKFAKKVYLIYRREKFSAEPIWIEEIQKNKKIITIFNSTITKLIGKNNLEEIELTKKKKLKIDGLFIEIGGAPGIALTKKLGVKITNKNEIIVDKNQKTNLNGVFAAGDITNNPLKQIITACAEGAIAADSIYKELIKNK